ncbi:MAG: hypothetical protein M1816_008239 [Peltula sp. TS41687]|nr:MAG: hypothetical protein M1816_008239 [Peltula sp. TS41687]
MGPRSDNSQQKKATELENMEVSQYVSVAKLTPEADKNGRESFKIPAATYDDVVLKRFIVSCALRWAGLCPTVIEVARVGHEDAEQRQEWRGLVLVHAERRLERMYSELGFKTNQKMGDREWHATYRDVEEDFHRRQRVI